MVLHAWCLLVWFSVVILFSSDQRSEKFFFFNSSISIIRFRELEELTPIKSAEIRLTFLHFSFSTLRLKLAMQSNSFPKNVEKTQCWVRWVRYFCTQNKNSPQPEDMRIAQRPVCGWQKGENPMIKSARISSLLRSRHMGPWSQKRDVQQNYPTKFMLTISFGLLWVNNMKLVIHQLGPCYYRAGPKSLKFLFLNLFPLNGKVER